MLWALPVRPFHNMRQKGCTQLEVVYARPGLSNPWADLEGGLLGLQPPPPKWPESPYIKYSTTDVLSIADTLIYIAKSLVIVVVMF